MVERQLNKMEISNQNRIAKIKQYFNFIVLLLIILIALFAWKENQLWTIIFGGMLILVIVGSQFLQINYVFYSSEGDKILIRYYPIIAFFGKDYNSIEFDKKLLYYAKIERMIGFSDLSIAIKTSKGIAEYPDVSLMGLSKSEIQLIENDLNKLLKESK